MIELVRANLGITLLPQSIYTKMVSDKIKMIPLNNPPLWNLGIITKKDRYQSYAARALIDYFKEQYTKRQSKELKESKKRGEGKKTKPWRTASISRKR